MKDFFSRFKRSQKFHVLLLAVVSVAVVLPILLFGLPDGHDMPHHYQCAMTFAESITAGDFYPSWSLNRNFGYGGMEIRLYPPLSHYVLAVFYLLIGNWLVSSWLALTLFTFAGSLGVYLLARETMPASQAVFAGCVYALMPYHLHQLYNVFFYAEFAVAGILPFVFLYISRVCRRGSPADVLGLTFSYAALILTHLPLTVIGSICFAIYALTLLKREKSPAQIVKLTAAVATAVVATSFFWVKVLLEKDLMAKALIYEDSYLDYRINFLLTGLKGFDGTLFSLFGNATYYYDLLMLLALLVALPCTIPFFIADKKFDAPQKSLWIVLGFAMFMTLPLSRFIWDHSSVLQEVQFPWRFLVIVAIMASVIAATRINRLAEWLRGSKRPLALLIGGCVLVPASYSITQIIYPANYLERPKVTAFMEKNQSDIGLKFWWTIWTRENFSAIREQVAAPDRQVEIEKWTATDKEFRISEGAPTAARIAVFYHPNWRATVDGVPVEVKPDETGAVAVPLAAGSSKINLRFEEPPGIRAARFISFLCWLILLPAFLFYRRRTPKDE